MKIKKKIMFGLCVFVLLLSCIVLVSSKSCINNLRVELNSYEKYIEENGDQTYRKSSYQPNGVDSFVREGDVLFVERLDVEKNLSCLDIVDSFTIQFKEPGSDEWTQNLPIPLNFEGGNKYSLWLENNKVGNKIRYRDSINSDGLSILPKTLDKAGIWGIRMVSNGELVHETWVNGSVSFTSGFRMVNGIFLIPKRIEVLDRIEVTQLETLRQIKVDSANSSNNSFWLVVIFGLFTLFLEAVTLGVMWVLGNKQIGVMEGVGNKQINKMEEYYDKQVEKEDKREEERQLDLLKTLYVELSFLEKKLKSYKKTFSKDKHYPFYELWNIDVSLYLKTLNHNIKGNKTTNLKENLMALKDGLIIINNMNLESRNEEERGRDRLVQEKIKSLRNGIINRIDKDILPLLKKSKKFIKKNWKL